MVKSKILMDQVVTEVHLKVMTKKVKIHHQNKTVKTNYLIIVIIQVMEMKVIHLQILEVLLHQKILVKVITMELFLITMVEVV